MVNRRVTLLYVYMYVCVYAYILYIHVEYILVCVHHTHTLSEYPQKLFLCILSHVVDVNPYNLFGCEFQLGREFDLVSAETLMPGAVLDIQ